MIRLFSPCAWGHGDWHFSRNAEGQLIKRCDRCQQPIGTLLSGEMIATPLVQHVAGEPKERAQPLHPKQAKIAQIGSKR